MGCPTRNEYFTGFIGGVNTPDTEPGPNRKDMLENTSIYQQSAVIPFRKRQGKTVILLIRNRSNNRWIIPKGIIEPHLSAAESAAAEALEEAGITGQVLAGVIGQYEYKKWHGTCQVQVFLMRVDAVLEHWQESFRERRWCTPQRAVDLVKEKALKKMIKTAFPGTA
jgi:phosphohistidine phosphatase